MKKLLIAFDFEPTSENIRKACNKNGVPPHPGFSSNIYGMWFTRNDVMESVNVYNEWLSQISADKKMHLTFFIQNNINKFIGCILLRSDYSTTDAIEEGLFKEYEQFDLGEIE